MMLRIVLTLIASAYAVNSQLTFNGSLSEILGSNYANDINNLQIFNNSNLPSLISLLDFLQAYLNVQTVEESTVSSENECTRQLTLLVEGLLNMDEWAVRMIDATAKLQPGIIEGNTMQIGHYDECLKIDVSVNGTQINGQYCTAAITDSTKEMAEIENVNDIFMFLMSYGFCIPAVCNSTYLTQLLRPKDLQSSTHLMFLEDFCDSSIKTRPFSTMTIISITFFETVGMIIILSTLYDVIISYLPDKKAVRWFVAFSLYTNGQKLFQTKRQSDCLGCLNGMRVISMLWIIAAHEYVAVMLLPSTNLIEIVQWTDNTWSVLMTGGNMGVDTFFMISGLLLVYIFMKSRENNRKVSVTMMYIHRIIRLTPSLAAVVLFLTTCFSYLGSGPIWHGTMLRYTISCKKYWWSTLLYIENYLNPNEMCMDQTWYLSVDTQLYFLSPVLLFPLIRWPKRTLIITLLIALVCSVGTFEITWLRNLGPAHFAFSEDENKYLYIATHVRAMPWLIGFITGYIIFYCRNRVIKISKIMVVLTWSLSITLMIGILLIHDRFRPSSEPDLLGASLFNALSRLLWALGLSVIIFLCVTGYGGFVNKFLSSPVFTVLIRVNYSMYLLHMVVIVCLAGQNRTPEYGSVLKNFYLFWGDTMITLLVSIVWTLAFESPIVALEKIIFGNENRPSPAPKILNNIVVIVDEDKVRNDAKIQM